LNLFRKADFFSLDAKYSRDDISDGQTARISLAFDGYDLSVVDYYGAEAGMPESAGQLSVPSISMAGRISGFGAMRIRSRHSIARTLIFTREKPASF